MEPTDSPAYLKQKLTESLQIIQSTLDTYAHVHTELSECNSKFTIALDNSLTSAQQVLPVFEALNERLTPEETEHVIQFATKMMSANRQLLKLLETYKEVGTTLANHITPTSESIRALSRDIS